MKLLRVDTIGEARAKLLRYAQAWPLKTETIPLGEAVLPGPARVLAEDVYAPSDIPSFRRSTVDGYAVVASDTAAAGEAIPVFLKQAGSVSMGRSAGFSIRPGECAGVPTGGMLPGGADAVVMAEYTEESGGNIAVYEAAAPGTGMAEAGEDVKKGEILLGRGKRIRAQEAGALAAVGVTRVLVFAPLCLSVISTGDELVAPDEEPRPGEVRDINSFALISLAAKFGYRVIFSRTLPDNSELLFASLKEAMEASDVVVISGGSSRGEKDCTAPVINRAAKPGVFTHGLAVKPGKPTILGWDDESKTLCAGLPGHPVSAMMVFELLLGWLAEELFGCSPALPLPARTSCNIPGSPGRNVCQPVILRSFENGYLAEPVFGKSGMITTLTRADGYIVIDLNREGLKEGEPVLVHLFRAV